MANRTEITVGLYLKKDGTQGLIEKIKTFFGRLIHSDTFSINDLDKKKTILQEFL